MLRFMYPELLWLLLLLPALAFWKGKKGKSPAIQYPSASILKKIGIQRKFQAGRWLMFLRMVTLAFVIIGLARPQLGKRVAEIEASGIDILLVMDISGSMEALDFTLNNEPASRIEVVKMVVSKFIDQRPNDRLGLIAFASNPYMVSPLTLDHSWLQQRLQSVEIGMIEDGTAIGSAIATGVNRLRSLDSKSRVIILLTDGVNNAGKVSPLAAAEAAGVMGIKIYTIGAGSKDKAPVPVTDPFGNRRLIMMKVDLDEETLNQVAQMTGGKYFRATDTDSLKNIYSEINQLETTKRSIKSFSQFQELFYWAIFPAILGIGLEYYLSQGKLRRLP
jgi:Ca-activated chloride channel family protein